MSLDLRYVAGDNMFQSLLWEQKGLITLTGT